MVMGERAEGVVGERKVVTRPVVFFAMGIILLGCL